MYYKYLKQYGIPGVLHVYIILKCMKVFINGYEKELDTSLLIWEIFVWTIGAFIYAYGYYYWYHIRANRKKNKIR